MVVQLDAPVIRSRLLAWFDRHRRDLPWRHTRDPYAIWVSEVMLQQTQVATVIPYFRRFLARFPDVDALARAPLGEVLGLWSGLGYYARARNLHRAAQSLARDGFPGSAERLRALPGFGRYTAAAVASIAFGERTAVLDGNVARVLARLLALEAPLVSLQSRLWREADSLLDPERPGAFNEAMMELGALLCTPANPRCLGCPLFSLCACRKQGLQARIPPPKVRPARIRLDLACAAVVRGSAILLGRREERGLFGGLWELPCARLDGRDPREALASLGFVALDPEPVARVQRALTHRELHLAVYPCRRAGRSRNGYLELRFVPRDQLRELGISTAMARAIAAADPTARPLRETRSGQRQEPGRRAPRARG